jgi:hypothetical protein
LERVEGSWYNREGLGEEKERVVNRWSSHVHRDEDEDGEEARLDDDDDGIR